MYDASLAQAIEKILQNSPGKEFKSMDIARQLHLKKHKRRDLEDTLRQLKRKRRISGKNKRYFFPASDELKEFTGIFDARPMAQNKSYAFVLQEKRDIYVSRSDTLNAYHGDEVRVAVKYEAKDYLHGYITAIIKRARERVVGKLQAYRGRFYLMPDNSRLHTDFAVLDKGRALPGDKVVLQISNWGDPEKRIIPAGKVIKVLGKAGDPDVEILSVICDYDLPLEFPSKVWQEAESIQPLISKNEISDRVDFRNLFTLTIDPASAKDYDDAISIKETVRGFELYVHIADVSHYVRPGTELYKEAVKRGNSYYFPRRVIPMLPEKLSNGVCSLRPREDKLTITVVTEYSPEGKILYQKAMESVICSDLRLSYEEVDEFFEHRSDTLNTEAKEALSMMRSLSALLQKKRIERGYLSLNLPETEYIFDEDGHVIDLKRSLETESHEIIENFMLSANEYVATELGNEATMYRNHQAPSPENIENLRRLAGVHKFDFDLSQTLNKAFQTALDSLETPERHRVFDRMILRNMQKACYEVENRGHFGLALANYTHFTSPIRRLCDLVVHLQLKAKLKGGEQKIFTASELQFLADRATEREQIADSSEREVDLKNKLLFMKKKTGEKFSGIVTAIKSTAIVIELDEYPVRGIIPLSSLKDDYYEYHAYYDTLLGTQKAKAIRLTDRFQVRLVRVDDDLLLEIIN